MGVDAGGEEDANAVGADGEAKVAEVTRSIIDEEMVGADVIDDEVREGGAARPQATRARARATVGVRCRAHDKRRKRRQECRRRLRLRDGGRRRVEGQWCVEGGEEEYVTARLTVASKHRWKARDRIRMACRTGEGAGGVVRATGVAWVGAYRLGEAVAMEGVTARRQSDPLASSQGGQGMARLGEVGSDGGAAEGPEATRSAWGGAGVATYEA